MLGKRLPSDLLFAEITSTSTCQTRLGKTNEAIKTLFYEPSIKSFPVSKECSSPTSPIQEFVSLLEEVPELSLESYRPADSRIEQDLSHLFEEPIRNAPAAVLARADSWEPRSPASTSFKNSEIYPIVGVYSSGSKSKTPWKASISSVATCAEDFELESVNNERHVADAKLEKGAVLQFMRAKTAARQSGTLPKTQPL